MTDFTITIYCFIDDFHKKTNHKEHSKRKVSDAEIMTTALLAARYFYGNFVTARQYMEQHHGMARLDKSNFNRHLHRLECQLWTLFQALGESIKLLNTESIYTIDSFPVATCHNIRIKNNKLLKGDPVYRGKCVSKREYFYGFKVQIIATAEGIPVEFYITAGSFADITAFQAMNVDLPEGSKLFADSAYNDYALEDDYLETCGIELKVCRKSNSRRKEHPSSEFIKTQFRKRIETTFSELTAWFPKRIHAVTPKGFLLKLIIFLFAFTLNKIVAA